MPVPTDDSVLCLVTFTVAVTRTVPFSDGGIDGELSFCIEGIRIRMQLVTLFRTDHCTHVGHVQSR